MAAFDKVESGFARMDEILDGIRLGDNVVWQISELEDFRMFAQAFAQKALSQGKPVIYIRFAQHPPLLEPMEGVVERCFNPDVGFEGFTVAIHNEITRKGPEAFYVFDCLSQLQSVWYTDLMMGNFFRVTCPYLFELDTVAYFPLIRGRHAFDTVARIRETTQLLLDVYSDETYVYLHPLKVWNRYSDKMFLPHCCHRNVGDFSAVDNGVGMSRYYRIRSQQNAGAQDQNYDSYDRFFSMAKLKYAQGEFDRETQTQIIHSTMTRDDRLKTLVRKYFAPEDFFALRERMIGSGAIGGKACGMLLARKIAQAEIPEYGPHNEPHDSFYIGSDVYYTYIVSNGAWRLRIRQRTQEGYFGAAEELRQHLLQGSFPPKIREQFLQVLEYFGQSPFIVRSSSFLEDGFGNAFAGKYESVFCVNQGSPEQRLEAFEQAVRRVYASTMDDAALEYRRKRGLDSQDEQMAVLVQRVSGSYYGSYFMPGAAGVGYSYSAYKWLRDLDPRAGMLRIVMGLGTRAVDRNHRDYPRLANLDRPGVTVMTTIAQKHKYSQRDVDVLDCAGNQLTQVPLQTLLPVLPDWYRRLVLERDWEAEQTLKELGRPRQVWFISCQKLLETQAFTGLMQQILKTLERVYQNPVDIEFAVNMDQDGEFVVNLLQCRPLYLGRAGEQVELKKARLEQVLFRLEGSSMGSSGRRQIELVVEIDPGAYAAYPYGKKYDIAAALEQINHRFQDRKMLLLTPGRIGTSSPELGVPVGFGGISNFSVICEVSDQKAGFMPELSYGSHIFQDLVEAEIAYGAILVGENTRQFHPELLAQYPDQFPALFPEFSHLTGIIHLRQIPGLVYLLDTLTNQALCGIEQEGNGK